MGLTATTLNRFRARVDETLEALFPCLLLVGDDSFPASGPGGRTVSEFLDGGESESFRFPFRVLKTAVPTGWTPIKGASLDWQISDDVTLALEIAEVSLRPHEDRYHFTCKNRRV